MVKGEPSKEKEKERKQALCYKCKKSGYFKADYPNLKKSYKEIKKKAIVAAQSDNNKSISDEENKNVVNLCLMAQDDEVTFELVLDFTFDELQDAFYNLLDEFRKISLKNKSLKIKNEALSKEKKEIIQSSKLLMEENKSLKKEVEKLKSLVDKFT